MPRSPPQVAHRSCPVAGSPSSDVAVTITVTVMDDVTPGDSAQWIGLGEAARRLGVTRAAIYGRIERKTLTTRPKGNRGLEVATFATSP